MIRLPPISTRTYTLFPYTTLFRSDLAELAFLVIGVDIGAVDRDDDHDRRAGGDALADLHLPVGNDAVDRRADDRAGEVELRLVEPGRRRRDIGRSEERRVGKACVRPGRSRWSPYH